MRSWACKVHGTGLPDPAQRGCPQASSPGLAEGTAECSMDAGLPESRPPASRGPPRPWKGC